MFSPDTLIKRIKSRSPFFTLLGASGFIGSRIEEFLIENELPYKAPRRDEVTAEDLGGHVIYCIGLTADYAKRPIDTVNAHCCLLNEIARQDNFDSLVYLSSTRLYDSCDKDVATEQSPLILNPAEPRHIYDISKALGESICLTTLKGKARAVRLSSVFSDDLTSKNFLHDLLNIASTDTGRRPVDSSANLARDYIYIDDVCQLILAVAVLGSRPIYNIASGKNIMNAELCEIINRNSNIELYCASETSDITFPTVNIEAIREDFGYTPDEIETHISHILSTHKQA